MKQLITIAIVLAAIFASTFIVIKITGILTVDDIKSALTSASEINPIFVSLAVIILLFSDLFIAIPNLTVCIFSGYFLGAISGGISAVIGMLMAGIVGYYICRYYGPGLLLKIYNDQKKLQDMQDIFSEHGGMILLTCRALPILPEICSCLAGATRMPFWRFFIYYSISTIPYAFIAAYAGSKSSLNNPSPAIFTAIGISIVLWLAWIQFLRRNFPK